MKTFIVIFLNVICFQSWGQIINDYNPPEKITSQIQDTVFIDPLSLIPIYIEGIKNIFGRDEVTGSAAGFVLEEKSKYYLVTNWHVVTNRNPVDSAVNQVKAKNAFGQEMVVTISDPEKLSVYFHGKQLGTWFPITLNLYESGKKLWLEHPLGRKVDVVALPLNLSKSQKDSITIYPLSFSKYNDDIIKYPSINLSIIGFPFGFSSYGRFPIWKTGQLASDFDLNFDGLPIFLIDAATRGGMSGSPVLIRQVGSTFTKTSVGLGGQVEEFLGVYSGRIGNDSDIGIVWKKDCLKDVVNDNKD